MAFQVMQTNLHDLCARQDQLLLAVHFIITCLNHPPATPLDAAAVPRTVTPLACSGSTVSLPLPPRYDGDPRACKDFINQCTIHFRLFPSDEARVAFIICLLTDKALAWVNPILEGQSPEFSDLSLFLTDFLYSVRPG
ncbi:protein LDOC1-like [Rhinoderma darwinii]|uniref:protein LDOC1-like n=1 Tax=Rhinoderma darwinii TaxID=43563 RepID=UPI003F666B14